MATEALRVADVRAWAYPVYFIHLVIVLALALTLPYTKLAHAVYRVLAVAGREYEVLLASRARRPQSRARFQLGERRCTLLGGRLTLPTGRRGTGHAGGFA